MPLQQNVLYTAPSIISKYPITHHAFVSGNNNALESPTHNTQFQRIKKYPSIKICDFRSKFNDRNNRKPNEIGKQPKMPIFSQIKTEKRIKTKTINLK